MEMRTDNSHMSRTTFNLHHLMPRGEERGWVKGERRHWIFVAAVWSRRWSRGVSRAGRGRGAGRYGMKRRRSRGGHPLAVKSFFWKSQCNPLPPKYLSVQSPPLSSTSTYAHALRRGKQILACFKRPTRLTHHGHI